MDNSFSKKKENSKNNNKKKKVTDQGLGVTVIVEKIIIDKKKLPTKGLGQA